METKIKKFLQTDLFIALFLGFLCHFLIASEIIAPDAKAKDTKSLHLNAFNSLGLSLGKKP